ncbi:MAG: M23 family metallopeptidase [Anaerolineae bacterium]|nr:M23 family metallopeptidase [Anaerolineae bacterium]
MRFVLVLIAITGACAACLIIGTTMLYAAGGLAASRTTRFIPFVGDQVSDQIEDWVLGKPTENVVEVSPFVVDGIEITQTEQYTGTVEERIDCQKPLGLPVAGEITQPFRPPYNPSHSGVDISVGTGTGVRATMCGTVTYSGWWEFADGTPGYGYLVVVSNGPYATYYAHNSQLLFGLGDAVEAGQIIALSGSTGWSTGPHVHYEVRVEGVPVNPL